MRHGTFARGTVIAAATTALLLVAGSAQADVSTFTGTSTTTCTRPSDPSSGTATGNGSCRTLASSTTCVTAVQTPEGTVASNCHATLDATVPLFFLLTRVSQDQVEAFCLGTGSGIFRYRPTPSSQYVSIPVTVSVKGQTAEFAGAAALGTNTATVSGTYTAACRGFGTFAGQVL